MEYPPPHADFTDFGTVGLLIGQQVFLVTSSIPYIVGSGNGQWGQPCGTLLASSDGSPGLCSIGNLTSRLLGTPQVGDSVDVWSLWTCDGEALRGRHERRKLAQGLALDYTMKRPLNGMY